MELKNLQPGEISEDLLNILADMTREYRGFQPVINMFDVLGRVMPSIYASSR